MQLRTLIVTAADENFSGLLRGLVGSPSAIRTRAMHGAGVF